jgi:hypothetical protein
MGKNRNLRRFKNLAHFLRRIIFPLQVGRNSVLFADKFPLAETRKEGHSPVGNDEGRSGMTERAADAARIKKSNPGYLRKDLPTSGGFFVSKTRY